MLVSIADIYDLIELIEKYPGASLSLFSFILLMSFLVIVYLILKR